MGCGTPAGRFKNVSKALQTLCDKFGVETRMNKVSGDFNGGRRQVDTKHSSTGRKVTGVKLEDGTVLEADVVVANPDIPESVRRFVRVRPGSGCGSLSTRTDGLLVFHHRVQLVLEETDSEFAASYNVFLSGEYETGWNRPATPEDFAAPKQHNFYCCNPVYTDKSCAPDGSR